MDYRTYTPERCVECTAALTEQTFRPVEVTFGGKTRKVPGLYRCVPCAGLVRDEVIRSNIDAEEAFKFLAASFVPRAYGYLMSPEGQAESPLNYALASGRLGEAVELGNELAAFLAAEAGIPLGDSAESDIARETAEAMVAKASETIRTEEDGSTTFQCPGCGQRHDTEMLFSILDNVKGQPA